MRGAFCNRNGIPREAEFGEFFWGRRNDGNNGGAVFRGDRVGEAQGVDLI